MDERLKRDKMGQKVQNFVSAWRKAWGYFSERSAAATPSWNLGEDGEGPLG
jgi:hypothetical protein